MNKENSWLVPRLFGDSWLGFKFDSPGVVPKFWFDGSPFDYANWQDGRPGSGTDDIYARVAAGKDLEKYGQWTNLSGFKGTYLPVCMTNAMSGPANPDTPDVTAPPHVDCEAGWHFVDNPPGCFLIDTNQRAWDAAEINCGENGAHLASINSPARQADLMRLAGLDPTSLGNCISFSQYNCNCSGYTVLVYCISYTINSKL